MLQLFFNFNGSVLKLVEPHSWQKYIVGGSSCVKGMIELFIIKVCFIFFKLAVG